MFGFDGEQKGFSPLALIGSLAAVAIIAFVGAYFVFKEPSSDQLVVIKAPTTPVRVAPEDKGGLKLNSIDSPVMDLLVDQANDDENTEILVPPVSEPELPPIDVTEDNASTSEDTANTVVETEPTTEDVVKEDVIVATPETSPVENVVTASETPSETASEDVANTPSDDTQSGDTQSGDEMSAALDQASGEKASEEQASETKASETKAEDNPLPRPKTPKIVNTTDNDAPSFVVQFAAFKNETRAKNTAAVLATKHANRLGEMTIGYMKRDQYWRVVTEPMPRADATALCRVFRSVGQDCITKLMESVQ